MIDMHFLNFLFHPVAQYFFYLVLTVAVLTYIFQKIKSNRTPHLPQARRKPSSTLVITSQDIKAISGEDVMGTQLDLARAYLEIKKNKMAKQILHHVVQHGNSEQKETAQNLMKQL